MKDHAVSDLPLFHIKHKILVLEKENTLPSYQKTTRVSDTTNIKQDCWLIPIQNLDGKAALLKLKAHWASLRNKANEPLRFMCTVYNEVQHCECDD